MSAPAVRYMDLVADPAAMAWSPSLPLELALAQQSVRQVCEAYGIDRFEYARLRADPNFQRAVLKAHEMLQQDGMAFKVKARAQAEQMLMTSWALVHKPLDEVSAAVKADLIKFTIRAAGLDASIEQKATAQASAASSAVAGLVINLHLGGD